MNNWTPGPALISTPLRESCRAIVILPARNEELSIAKSLDALSHQVDLDGIALPATEYEIIVLLNNCTDGSERQVEAFVKTNPQIPIHSLSVNLSGENANIGYVRRILMDEACRRFLEIGNSRGAILSTDADTVVSSTWIEQNCQALASGLDGVGGRIVLDALEMDTLPEPVRHGYELDIRYNLLRSELEALIDPVECDPWPRHHQHFAASLAVQAEAYRRVGGLPHVEHLEDIALWDALTMADAKLRHSPSIVVRTSARMDGRVGIGLSEHLRGLSGPAQPQVESAISLRKRFEARRVFRLAWINSTERNRLCEHVNSNIQKAAELSGIDVHALEFILRTEPSWSKALQTSNIESQVTRHLSTNNSQSLSEAVDTLETMLSEIRNGIEVS